MSSGVTNGFFSRRVFDLLSERLLERDQVELVEGFHQPVELFLGDYVAVALEAGRIACDREPGALDLLQGIRIDIAQKRPVRRVDDGVLVSSEMGRYLRQQVRVLGDLSVGFGSVAHETGGMDQAEPHRADNRTCTVECHLWPPCRLDGG